MNRDNKYQNALNKSRRGMLNAQQKMQLYLDRTNIKGADCPDGRIIKTSTGTVYAIPCNKCVHCKQFDLDEGERHVR